MNYQELYTHYRNLKWVNGLLIGLVLSRQFEKPFQDDLDRIHKEIYPRRRVIKWDAIPDEILDATRHKWQERAMVWFLCAKKRVKWLNGKLDRACLDVQITEVPEQIIYRSDSYQSQGYGADKYSRMDAENWAAPLIAEGWPARVFKEEFGYAVWCTLPDWGCDAVRRRSTQSVMNWAIGCWKKGVNPKVYSPFMSYEVWEKSMNIAMRG